MAVVKISYDPSVDALYIRFGDEAAECETIRINDQVAVNIGPQEQVIGIEVLDAAELLAGIDMPKVQLENLVAA